MPTPMPTSSQFEQLQNNLSEIIKQGVTGFVILVGISIVLVSAAILVMAWSRRNTKPVDSTAGTNAAINAFAVMINLLIAELTADRLQQKEENESNRIQNKELQEQYIESISANADATNRIADNHDKLIALWQSEIGSKPYQGLIETAARIETSVDTIVKKLQPAEKEAQKKQVQDIQKSIDELKQFVVTIVQNLQTDKRATGSLKPVTMTGTQDSIDDK